MNCDATYSKSRTRGATELIQRNDGVMLENEASHAKRERRSIPTFDVPNPEIEEASQYAHLSRNPADDIIQSLRLNYIIVSRVSLSIILVQVVTLDFVPRES